MEESALGRVIGVLVAPRRTFEALARRPTWLAPLLLLVVAVALDNAVIAHKTDFLEIAREARARGGEEADDAQLAAVAALMQQVAVPFAAFTLLVSMFLLALVAWVALQLVGGELSFTQSLGTTMHGMVPWILAMAFSLPDLLARPSFSEADLQRIGFLFPSSLPTSLASLAPAGTGLPVTTLLGSLDLFSLWSIVLLTLGFSVAARVSKTTAAATVLTLWAVYLLGKAGWVLVGTA